MSPLGHLCVFGTILLLLCTFVVIESFWFYFGRIVHVLWLFFIF